MDEAVHEALPVGTRLNEFRIDGVLGVGGFGITYQGKDETLQRPVAIKEYLPLRLARRAEDGTTVAPRSATSLADYSVGLDRFRSEARILARFNHPSIVGVSRFIEDNDTGYLVMNFVQGCSLAEMLQDHATLEQGQMLAVVCPLLDALALIHSGGFLHRDIKPANIFLRSDKTPVLIDFGSARQAVTRQTTIVLTPGFAPLEQYSEKEGQTPATDLYALGATMYRCVTGGRPETAPARMSAHYEGREDPVLRGLAQARGRYRDDVLGFIRWMLSLSPRERPRRAEDLLARLAPLRDEFDGKAPRPTTKTVREPSVPTERRRPSARGQGGEPGRPSHRGLRLSPSDRAQVAELLARHAGPIAKVLVARELRRGARNIDELGQRLSRQLATADDARAFLGDLQLMTRLN